MEIITKITFIKNEKDLMRTNPSTEGEGKSVEKIRFSKNTRDTGLKTAEENGGNESQPAITI